MNTAYNKHLNGFFGDEDELGEVFKDGFSSWESFLSEKTVGFYLLNPEKLGGRVMIVKLRLCKRPLVRKIITELIGGDWILEASVVDRSHRLQLYFSLVISEKAKRDVMHTILTNRDCNYLVIADWKPAKLIAGKFFVVQGIITSHKQIEVM